jgi:hypothetical protein
MASSSRRGTSRSRISPSRPWSIDDEDFSGRFTIVVTVDLVAPLDPEPVEPASAEEDRDALDRAAARWTRAGLDDYRYTVTVHCECPPESSGPFLSTVREGKAVATELVGDPTRDAPEPVTIDDLFDEIATSVADGTDVDVDYDELVGLPTMVIIDPDAVAVDGGLAFSISDFEPLGDHGYIAGTLEADEPIPDVPIFIGPLLGDGLVPMGASVDGSFFIAVLPGMYAVGAQRIDGVGQPRIADVDVGVGDIVRVTLRYEPLDPRP